MGIHSSLIQSIFKQFIVVITFFFSASCALSAAPCDLGQQEASESQAKKPAQKADAVSQWLIAEEKSSWDLAIEHDAAAYTALHAPNFFTVSGSGVSDKSHSESSAMDEHVSFASCRLTEFDVHFTGENAALITYRVGASGLDHGKDFKIDQYVSSLWMKRDGRWLNVFYQATPKEAE